MKFIDKSKKLRRKKLKDYKQLLKLMRHMQSNCRSKRTNLMRQKVSLRIKYRKLQLVDCPK